MTTVTTATLGVRTFVRFLFVGGAATLLQYLIMALLLWFSSASAELASCIGFVFSALFNYWTNAHFTFGRGHNWARALRFVLTTTAALAINWLALHALLAMQIPLWPAQIVATGMVFVWNYVINALWTFAEPKS